MLDSPCWVSLVYLEAPLLDSGVFAALIHRKPMWTQWLSPQSITSLYNLPVKVSRDCYLLRWSWFARLLLLDVHKRCAVVRTKACIWSCDTDRVWVLPMETDALIAPNVPSSSIHCSLLLLFIAFIFLLPPFLAHYIRLVNVGSLKGPCNKRKRLKVNRFIIFFKNQWCLYSYIF